MRALRASRSEDRSTKNRGQRRGSSVDERQRRVVRRRECLIVGDTFEIAGTDLVALHTPGHSPGSTCFYAVDLDTVFSGDTLFNGGPGATGRSYSDFGTIIESIRKRLLTLPDDTAVLTGHGDSTSIGSEAPHYEEWVARGH